MSDLIKVKNASYDRYEELLLLRDQYEREADSILIAYTAEFGDLTAAIFETKVECIRLKKMIAYCQIAINRGRTIDLTDVDERLQLEMAGYYEELAKILARNQAARESQCVGIGELERIKKLYRRLAKQLHPDINPMTAEIKELADLWNRIVIAYKGLNARELTDLEVLANKLIGELGLGTLEIEIPNIEERIHELEQEISQIITTEPYTYHHILDDPKETEQLRSRLQTELNETEEYRQSLDGVLQDLLAKGGNTITWQMSLQ